jgi:hypothetical protein
MNFDFKIPYIELDPEDNLNKIYEIEGLCKITELSRQLRTFLNYKAATIKIRFNQTIFSRTHLKIDNTNEIDFRLKCTASNFISLLNQIKGKSVSYEIELKNKIMNFLENEADKNQIKKIMNLTKELFTSIHLLSEGDIYLNPLLFKLVLNLSQEACIVYKILKSWSSGFYEELSLNYGQLLNELNEILRENQKEKCNKHQNIEEGLKN